jgi:hypothetical protein
MCPTVFLQYIFVILEHIMKRPVYICITSVNITDCHCNEGRLCFLYGISEYYHII